MVGQMAARYEFWELHSHNCQQHKYVCGSLLISPKDTEISK